MIGTRDSFLEVRSPLRPRYSCQDTLHSPSVVVGKGAESFLLWEKRTVVIRMLTLAIMLAYCMKLSTTNKNRSKYPLILGHGHVNITYGSPSPTSAWASRPWAPKYCLPVHLFSVMEWVTGVGCPEGNFTRGLRSLAEMWTKIIIKERKVLGIPGQLELTTGYHSHLLLEMSE